MLEDIDRIDWKKLTCRQGPASEAPKQLRALADESKAPKAFITILASLIHAKDHVVFSATAAAVPFVWEIATSAGPVSQEHALCLLRDFATFRGDDYLLRGVATAPDAASSSNSFEAVPARVREGTKALPELLTHASDRVRCSAAILAGIFPTQALLGDVLSALGRESSARATGGLLIAAGLGRRVLAIREPDDLRGHLHSESDLVRAAAAIAIALYLRDRDDEIYDALEEAEESKFVKDYTFWNEGKLDAYAKRAYDA